MVDMQLLQSLTDGHKIPLLAEMYLQYKNNRFQKMNMACLTTFNSI